MIYGFNGFSLVYLSSEISAPPEGTSAPRSAKRRIRRDPTWFKAMQGGRSTTSWIPEPGASAVGMEWVSRVDALWKRLADEFDNFGEVWSWVESIIYDSIYVWINVEIRLVREWSSGSRPAALAVSCLCKLGFPKVLRSQHLHRTFGECKRGAMDSSRGLALETSTFWSILKHGEYGGLWFHCVCSLCICRLECVSRAYCVFLGFIVPIVVLCWKKCRNNKWTWRSISGFVGQIMIGAVFRQEDPIAASFIAVYTDPVLPHLLGTSTARLCSDLMLGSVWTNADWFQCVNCRQVCFLDVVAVKQVL